MSYSNTTLNTNLDINLDANLENLLIQNLHIPSYNLTQDEIIWIQTFIQSSPNTFSNIVTDIQTITSDGKINIQDIPSIVKLLSDIYTSHIINIQVITNPINILSIIKYTFDVIIECELIPLPNIEKTIIKTVFDSCLNLLITNLPTIEIIEEEVKNTCYTWCCLLI